MGRLLEMLFVFCLHIFEHLKFFYVDFREMLREVSDGNVGIQVLAVCCEEVSLNVVVEFLYLHRGYGVVELLLRFLNSII